MSQPNPIPDYNAYATKRETHRLAAVPPAPAGALGGKSDPTQEISALIAQLQSNAREAQDQLALVQRERDELCAQLEEVSARLREAKTHDEETRAKFVEVTSVIRERDELLESVDAHQKSIAELQRRIDAVQVQEADLHRQRGKLLLERDRALQERDAVTKERDEVRAKLAEMQKQFVTLRQARDAAQAQCRELTNKTQQLDDELHELTYERDQARKQLAEAADSLRLRDETIAERNELAERLAQATRDLEAERKRFAEFSDQRAKTGQATDEHAAALAQAREEVQKLTRELDSARAELQRAQSAPAVDAAAVAERDALLAKIAEHQQREAELLGSLTAAQKQIGHIIRDRDQVRQQGIDRAIELEREAKTAIEKAPALEAKLKEAERLIAEAQRERDEVIEKARNFEQQRLAAIDIAAQLDAAKREIKTLTADLAEARLEARAAHSRGAALKTPPPLPKARPAASAAAEPPKAKSAPAVELDEEVLTEKEAKSLQNEIKRCYTAFTKSPTDFSLLNELHCQAQHFAERARVSGFLGLYRIGHAFGNLAQNLYKHPEQVNPSTLRTISQTIDLIGTLLKQKDYAALADPAKALVFAVDDDSENCELIRLAMECIGVRTRSAQEPAVALAEISADAYNLIFLDVALPHMDGFELCQHIRALPNHAHTPVVFLTGLTTIENRVQSSLSGGNDFVGKPFNLQELGVKAISLLLKASLHME